MLYFHDDQKSYCSDYTNTTPQISQNFTAAIFFKKKKPIKSQSVDFSVPKHPCQQNCLKKSKYYQKKANMVKNMMKLDAINKRIQKYKAMRQKATRIELSRKPKSHVLNGPKPKTIEKKIAVNRQKKNIMTVRQYQDVKLLISEVGNVCGKFKRRTSDK